MVVPTGRALLDPYVSLERTGLSQGMSYADLGSGTLGHFAFPATKLVGEEGHVYAVDILKSALEAIGSRAREAGVHQLTTIWGDIERPGGVNLADHSLDVVSLINMGRQLNRGTQPLVEARRLLAHNGRLLVVDWKVAAEGLLASKDDLLDPNRLEAQTTELGFKLVDSFDAGKLHWGRVFQISS